MQAACTGGRPGAPYAPLVDAAGGIAVPAIELVAVAGDTTLPRFDTRSYAEYAVSRLPGAQWMGYDSLDLSLLQGHAPDDTLVVYCSVGLRSAQVAARLRALGYTQVFNLQGGLFAWVNEGYPLTDARGQPTDTVHGYASHWGMWLTRGVVVY
ncbi:MAG: hypothetical protein OHK0039_42230 [Bacteroidia bacterium]